MSLDVYSDFIDRYNDGSDPSELHKEILERHAQSLTIESEWTSVWLGLARAQWECGSLSSDVLTAVEKIISSGADLHRWHPEDRKRRQQLLDDFLVGLSTPNLKPKRRVKRRIAKEIFQPGACLAVETRRGGYGAALVLKVVTTKYETKHLIGGLCGMFDCPPSIDIYEKRDWLRLTHGNFKGELHRVWCGAKSYLNDTKECRIIEIGKTELRPDDPTAEPNEIGIGYSSWGWIENQIRLQHERGPKNV